MKYVLQPLAVLTAASALLCAALWATVWTPGQGVQPSSADITDLFASEGETTTTKFQRALDHLGHEPARAFDLNGNTVYFSVNFVDNSPTEVLKRYQDEFVYQGINQASYTSIDSVRTQQARRDMLTGGLVPTEISAGFITMGGGVTENRARDDDDLVQLGVDLAKDRLPKTFRAYRSVEIFREPGARWTTVAASWSDEAFDYRKMRAGSDQEDQMVDARIPACPGCTRLQRFEDLDPSAGHVDHIFIGQTSPLEMLRFYDRALGARGWSPAPSSAVLARAKRLNIGLPDAHVRHYIRGSQTLTLTSYVGPDQDTLVHLNLSGR
jgi:hypothetical protein